MKISKQSHSKDILILSLPVWIPPVLFALYYPLFSYLIEPGFGPAPADSVIPGVSANDITYLFFAGALVLCLLAIVILKGKLANLWQKVLYVFFAIALDSALCWFFLQMHLH